MSAFDRQIGHCRRYRCPGLATRPAGPGSRSCPCATRTFPGWFAWLLVARMLGRTRPGGSGRASTTGGSCPATRWVEARITPRSGSRLAPRRPGSRDAVRAGRAEPCLSVVMPCYNEDATIADVPRAVLASPVASPRSSSSTTAPPTARRELARPTLRPTPRVRRAPPAAQPGQGRGAAHRLRRGHRGRTSIVQDADLEYDPADYAALLEPIARRPGRRRLRLALPRRPAPPRPLLLALRRQPVPDAALEHVHQPEPHRHGDLLQGLPPRGDPAHRARGGPLRLRARDHGQGRRAAAAGSTRSASPTTAAPTPRARRSAGATASAPSTASCGTRRSWPVAAGPVDRDRGGSPSAPGAGCTVPATTGSEHPYETTCDTNRHAGRPCRRAPGWSVRAWPWRPSPPTSSSSSPSTRSRATPRPRSAPTGP